MDNVIKLLLSILNPLTKDKNINYLKHKSETVLINSNFNCGYFIDREKLFDIIKYNYKINCAYDPCSYPGIQCEFHYNPSIKVQTGQQLNNDILECIKVSFMIFRTGSVLIVGKCSEEILEHIYNFLKTMLLDEFNNIGGIIRDNNHVNNNQIIKRKIRKKTISIIP